MIGCGLVAFLAILAFSFGPGYHVVCHQHADQKVLLDNPVSDKSLQAQVSAEEVQTPRDGRALKGWNLDHGGPSQTHESTSSNVILGENVFNPLEEDSQYFQQNLDAGLLRQGQFANPWPVAPIVSRSNQPIQSHHEIESGQYDSYETSLKPSPLPGFLKTLAACVPLSFVAAAIPLGFANLGGGTRTVTISPAPVTMTITMSITQMAMENDEGRAEMSLTDPDNNEDIDEGSGEDTPLQIRSKPQTPSVVTKTYTNKRQQPQAPALVETTTSPSTNITKNLKAQPRADIVNAIFTPRAVGPTSSLESILNLTPIDEMGEADGSKYLFSVESTSENLENDVFTLPLANQLSGNWTFDDPDDTSNLIVSKVGDEVSPVEIVRLNTQEVKDTMVFSEELKHEDVPNLQVQSNIVRKAQQNTSPKPKPRSRLPRLNLKNWGD